MSFLVAAYAVLWAGVFGYLLWLASRLRALREEARSLAHEIAKDVPRPPAESAAGR